MHTWVAWLIKYVCDQFLLATSNSIVHVTGQGVAEVERKKNRELFSFGQSIAFSSNNEFVANRVVSV